MSDAYTGAAFITCRLTINAKHSRWAHSKQSDSNAMTWFGVPSGFTTQT